jgi:aryl-alcohol dehydrogenase-like predicted oxidoreductase
MKYRKLGKTGLKVSEVSLGCNRLGSDAGDDRHWDDLVKTAIDRGVNYFDTSENYAATESEKVLGRVVGNRDNLYIETKMGRNPAWRSCEGYSKESMIEAVNGSLERLKRETIDVYMLHSPSREELERDDWREAMDFCRKEGKIRHIGIAANNVSDCLYIMENNLASVIQMTYNIMTFDSEKELFPLAEKTETGLVCRLTLARGVLTGKFTPGKPVPDENRASLSNKKNLPRLEKTEQLRPLAADYPGCLVRLAHHFSLTPPQISCIIPGARNKEQLLENISASNGKGLPGDILERVQKLQKKWGASEDAWY